MKAKSHDHGHAHSHPTPGMLIASFFSLAILMAATMAVYYVDLGHIISSKLMPGNEVAGSYINNIIALSIAVCKAVIVVQIFMGAKFGSNLVKLWAYIGFITLPLMLIIFGDIGTRHWEEGKSWTNPGRDVAPFRSDVDPTFKELNEKYGHHAGGHGEETHDSGH